MATMGDDLVEVIADCPARNAGLHAAGAASAKRRIGQPIDSTADPA